MHLRLIVVGGMAFGLVAAVAAAVYVPRIEADLTERSLEALSLDFEGAEVRFEGRAATVSLPRVPGRADRTALAEEAVGDVWGVSSVEVIPAPPLSPRVPPMLRVTVSAEFAEFIGRLPEDVDFDALREQIARSVGRKDVRVVVDKPTAEGDSPRIEQLLAGLEAAIGRTRNLSLEVTGRRATLRGGVVDRAAREAVLSDVTEALGGLPVKSFLAVRPPDLRPEDAGR